MKDHTLNEAIVEAARFIKAAKKLRANRVKTKGHTGGWMLKQTQRFNAEVERAALDCRYKLADLRAGR